MAALLLLIAGFNFWATRQISMKRVFFVFVVLSWSVWFPIICFAGDWYVRKGATGSNNGTNWTDAWNEMNQINWDSVAAGDTIWLAGGTYTSVLAIGKSGTSENRIYVKRVLSTDTVPASAPGWNASYDSQVIINTDQGIYWGTTNVGSYVTVDGQVDSGIKSITPGNSWDSSSVRITASNTGVTLQYIDLAGPGGSGPYTFANDCKVLSIYNASPTNLTVRHSRLHGCVDQVMLLGIGDGFIFEYNRLYDNNAANYATYHPGTVAMRACSGTTTYRYNEHYNWSSEGIMLGANSGDQCCTWKIYGNIWHSPFEGTARALELQYCSSTVYFYNNTMVGLGIGIRALNGASFAHGSQIYNNIFYNSGGPGDGTTGITDYNAYSGGTSETHGVSNMPSSAFGKDYTIVSTVGVNYPRNKGYALASEYNTDPNGVTRGSDGAWDIGAYEYVSGAPDTTPPAAPTGLRIK
jgi:hypothetical protein